MSSLSDTDHRYAEKIYYSEASGSIVTIKEEETAEKHPASKDDFLAKLLSLGEVPLKEGATDLISLLEDVESILSSEELTDLERQGFILIREYLKEATILELRKLPRASLTNKIREIASILKNIDNLRGKGIQIISLGDLTVVGEIDGRPIYSIRQEDKRDSSNR